jgi:hypothetical protein
MQTLPFSKLRSIARSFAVQPPPVMVRIETIARAVVLLAVVVTAASGCARKIGDECTTAADCNPNGTRSCDQSQPGGYCTIQGCDETSCPDDSVCVRYFPAQFLTKPCDPSPDMATMNGCAADEFCLPEGLCAPRTQELRYCVKTCGSNDDCRGGYECRLAGTRGSVALTSNVDDVVHFCAPNGS